MKISQCADNNSGGQREDDRRRKKRGKWTFKLRARSEPTGATVRVVQVGSEVEEPRRTEENQAAEAEELP